MSAATCFYHPDQVASTTCAQCAVPLCPSCVETVANRSVCRRCVSAIRSRVASEMNVGTPAPGVIPTGTIRQPTSGRVAAPTADMSVTGVLLGGLYGALIGLVGAFLLDKIQLATGMRVGLFNSLIGFGVGFGVLLGCKRGGLVPAVMGGVLAFFAMMLSEYLYFQDLVAKYVAERPDAAAAVSSITFMDHLSHLTMGWLFIAIGIYGGAKTPLRAGR